MRLLKPALSHHNQLPFCATFGFSCNPPVSSFRRARALSPGQAEGAGGLQGQHQHREWGLGKKPGHHCEVLSEGRARDPSYPRVQELGTGKHGHCNSSLQGTQEIILGIMGPVLLSHLLPSQAVVSPVAPSEFSLTLRHVKDTCRLERLRKVGLVVSTSSFC